MNDFDATKCKWHEDEIHEMKRDLYGNGNEGMKVRFARLETKVKLMLSLEVMLLAGMASLVVKAFLMGGAQ